MITEVKRTQIFMANAISFLIALIPTLFMVGLSSFIATDVMVMYCSAIFGLLGGWIVVYPRIITHRDKNLASILTISNITDITISTGMWLFLLFNSIAMLHLANQNGMAILTFFVAGILIFERQYNNHVKLLRMHCEV